jgi:hypothetical protein
MDIKNCSRAKIRRAIMQFYVHEKILSKLS